MLSLSDIDRWDPDAVIAVFRAAIDRAHGVAAASTAVGDVMVFADWDGDAAEAARAAAAATMVDLDRHAAACAAVAHAAEAAAEEITALKARLATVRADAEAGWLVIDDETGAVSPPGPDAVGLARRVCALLADARVADQDLAAAIRGADGDLAPERVGATGFPEVPAPGTAPEAVNAWWRGLSPAQQDTVKDWSAEAIRNLDGIPAVVRDTLNRAVLTRELARLRDGWLDGAGHWRTNPDAVADLTALQATLQAHPGLGLLLLDTAPGRVLAAVAAGDVDNAARVSVTVGGMGTDVATSVAGMAGEAIALRDSAVRLRGAGSVASIAWLGYRAPGPTLAVTSAAAARAGAGPLNRFYRGLAAASQVPGVHITALGHSYGSLTTSLALQAGAPVSDVVLYGSPGAEITDAAQLGVAPGHAFFEVGMNDGVPLLAQTHRFGPPLWDVPGLVELSTRPGFGADGWHAGAYGHSEYARTGPNGALRMSGYNMAAVLAGLPGVTPPAVPVPGRVVVVGP